MRLISHLMIALLLTGCQLPQWRVGQQTVPEPIKKPPVQIEAERASAKLIEIRLSEVIATLSSLANDPVVWSAISPSVRTLLDLRDVSVALSESLGQPTHPVSTAASAIKALDAGIRTQQKEIDRLNAKLGQLQGKPLEGTGVNLFGWAGGLGGIGLIAACIACPSLIGVLWWLLKRSGSALRAVVSGVEQFADEHPVDAAKLQDKLSKVMDSPHKKLVKKIRATL